MQRSIFILFLIFSSLAHGRELSQYIAVKVQKAYQFSQDEKTGEAIRLLKNIETSRTYDKAYIARMLGIFYWQEEQVSDAILNLKAAVDSKQLSKDIAWSTEKMLADIHLSSGQYDQALSRYYSLVKTATPEFDTKDLWLRIAQSHYQLSQWNLVISSVNKYFKNPPKDKVQPLSLKLGAQLELKKWNQAVLTLKSLLEIKPEKSSWWRQLALLQVQVGKPRDAVNTLSLAKINGVELSQHDLRILAQLYAQVGLPERAALEISQLHNASTDVQLLFEQAVYWRRAKEWDKSIEVWRSASNYKSKYRWNLVELLLQQQRYQEVLNVTREIKGKPEKVAMTRVQAFYKLGEIDKALLEAKKASEIKPSKQSQRWIKFLSQLNRETNDGG
jgi:hypothetical protein